jgi:flagellar motor switch/type III secretory pathway protein FliN
MSTSLRRPAPPEINFWPSQLFLVVGLLPLGMLFQFWFRSGTGLHPMLVGFTLFGVLSFALALNYHLFYRQNRPRSALVPPAFWKGLLVAGLLVPLGAYNMLATSLGVSLTLSPGPRIEAEQLPIVIAKVVGTALTPGQLTPLVLERRKTLEVRGERWFKRPPYMNGALWGALGYAVPFGLLGALLGLMRKELADPRDEHLGQGLGAALVRGAVGHYYGMAVGFALGAVLIGVVRTLFPAPGIAPDEVRHFLFALGAGTNPNTAFTYAFSTGCVLAGAFALVARQLDLTAGLSDPKAPELTRPVEILVPEVPELEPVAFDMGAVRAESQAMLRQFHGQLKGLLEDPQWEYERYDMPAVGTLGQRPEPEATHVLSARLPVGEDDTPTALGSLSNVYVPIVAELGKLEIPAFDWLGLAEGAVLELPKTPDGTIQLTVAGKPVGRAKPLTVNGYKAVKLVGLRQPVETLLKTP